MRKRIFLTKFRLCLYLLFLVFNFTNAQVLDSLRRDFVKAATPLEKSIAMGAYAFELSAVNPDSALMLSKKGLRLAVDLNNDEAIARNEQSIGWCYYRLGNNDSAIAHLWKAYNLFHQLELKTNEGRCLVNLSSVYTEQQNYQKALSTVLPAHTLFEETGGDKLYLAYVDKMLGSIYRHLQQYDLAKSYLQSALETFTKLHSDAYIGDASSALGSVYWQQRNFDSALYHYRGALSIFTQTKKLSSAAYASENMGDAFAAKAEQKETKDDFDSALIYYARAHDIFKIQQSEGNIYYEEYKIGNILGKMKQYDKATDYLLRSFKYFDSAKDIVSANGCAESLSDIYNNKGDYKNAYKYEIFASAYRDSINARNSADSIARMFATFETDKKDKTIKLLNAQNQLADKELSRQQTIMIFSIAFILLLVVVAVLMMNRYRIKQKLKELEMRNQLASDLHDDIGSSLSSILLLSKMALQKNGEEIVSQPLLDKISSNATEVIERMSDIVWTMNPKYDEGERLIEKVESYILHLKEITSINFETDFDEKLRHLHFSMEMRKNIFLLIKESLNNSLKHTDAKLVQVKMKAKENNLHITISDDGKGFDVTTVQEGNGLTTIANRAKAMNGVSTISSEPGKGAKVFACFPLPHFRYMHLSH